MPPKKRRQLANSINYRKRKDMAAREQESMTTEVAGVSVSGETRVKGGLVRGETRVDGGSVSYSIKNLPSKLWSSKN
jgi:hypothetical protein